MKERIVKFGKRTAAGVALTIMAVTGAVMVPQAASALVDYPSATYSTSAACLRNQGVYQHQLGAIIMVKCRYESPVGGYRFWYVFR